MITEKMRLKINGGLAYSEMTRKENWKQIFCRHICGLHNSVARRRLLCSLSICISLFIVVVVVVNGAKLLKCLQNIECCTLKLCVGERRIWLLINTPIDNWGSSWNCICNIVVFGVWWQNAVVVVIIIVVLVLNRFRLYWFPPEINTSS